MSEAADLRASVLLMVAADDSPAKLNGNQNMTDIVKALESDLSASGVSTDLIVYPSVPDGHGHTMFFEVGDYFADIEDFLRREL